MPSRTGAPDGGIAMAMTKVKFAGAAAAVLAAGVLIAVTPGRAQQQPLPEAAGPGGDGARRDGPPMRGMPWMSGRMGGGMGMMGRGHRMCDERVARLAQWRIERIELAVKPTDAQRGAFDELKAAAAKAADIVRTACPAEMFLTPTGRLESAEKQAEARLQ